MIAAQLSSPQPIKYGTWFSNDDFPNYIVAAGQTRNVKVRAVVRPDGTLQGCGIETSSGDKKLDQWTCVLVAKRARWVDGTSAFGVDRIPVVWAVGDDAQNATAVGDLELTVNRLAAGLRSPAFVNIMFTADELGKPLSCIEAPLRAKAMKKADPALLSLACRQFLDTFRAIPPQDDTGMRVRSVQNALVKFVVKK